MTKAPSHIDPIAIVLEIIDNSIQFYLLTFVSPFLKYHEKFYSRFNVILRDFIEKLKPPKWFTANFITYARTVLVIPCVLCMAWGYVWTAAMIVLLVDFGDFLDGVVARYWVDKRKARQARKQQDQVVVDTSQPISSWQMDRRNDTYGGFVDANCDKAFVIPCWIFLLSTVSGSFLENLQYFILWYLVLAESASGTIRFRAFFTSLGVPTPSVVGLEFSSSAVKADHVGKAKQTFEMVGTSLFIIPQFRIFGIVFLLLALPLAYESVRRKIQNRIIFIHYTSHENFDHTMLKFWMQAKNLGSKLIVGVPGDTKSTAFRNASSVSCVDAVLAKTPAKVDVKFLELHNINYYVCPAGKSKGASETVLLAKQCLAIGDDDVARVVESKGSLQN